MDLREENRKLLELYEPLRVADVRDGMDWMGYSSTKDMVSCFVSPIAN